jgi:hypothetical protein
LAINGIEIGAASAPTVAPALKILVEKAHIYPVLAQVLTTTIVILFSYLAQRHFSFKAGAEEEEGGCVLCAGEGREGVRAPVSP